MLSSLRLENFKAWRKLDIEFGKVTGLFGNSSSGKSSVFQFLLMLKQTKNATNRRLVLDFGGVNGLVNLGNFRDVVHKHDEKEMMRWRIDWTAPVPRLLRMSRGELDDIILKGDQLQTECGVTWAHSELQARYLRYNFGESGFALQPVSADRSTFRLTTNLEPRFRFLPNRHGHPRLHGPIKTHLFPSDLRISYGNANFLNEFEFEYESLMEQVFYLGPLREYPRREYSWAGAVPYDVGLRGEGTVEAILAATANGEERSLGPGQQREPFQGVIGHWLKRLGLVESFEIHEVAEGSNLYRTRVKTHRESSEVALTDIGVGVSQVLPALVLLYYVPERSIVLLEQPEIHLHPSVQSGLADLILTVAKTRHLQVILESHSEHLLRRFQRRVAEERMASEDITLYFTSMAADGTARLQDLELNAFGEIMNWPESFFGNELEEIAATRTAGLGRKAGRDTRERLWTPMS